MAYLPPWVVTELELNSVNPPPDTIEEDSKPQWASVNADSQSLIRITQLNVRWDLEELQNSWYLLSRNGLQSLRLDQSV